jgi:phage gp46-like protein
MNDKIKQIDLSLSLCQAGRLVSDREYADLRTTVSGDLTTVTGPANLIQAIVNRLFTRKGELAKLGHPSYGSRLHQLIGELNNTRVRGLAEIYIRESLAQESRIREITQITFAPPSRGIDRSVLQATIAIKPVGQEGELTFIVPIRLEG